MSKVKEAELVPVNGQEIAPRGDADMLMIEAVKSGNIDIMERVMAIRRELKAEATKEGFFEALTKFQSLVPKILKKKQGYGYLYAPLEVIEDAIKKPMQECGLSKRWVQTEADGQVTIACVVTHVGGHSEESAIGPVGWDALEKTKQMNALQHRGAVITYLKRYTICAALGIATADADPDGAYTPKEAREARQPVSQPKETPTAQKAAQKGKAAQQPDNRPRLLEADETHPPITESQGDGLSKAMKHSKLTIKDFTDRFGLHRLGEIRVEDVKTVLKWIADPEKN